MALESLGSAQFREQLAEEDSFTETQPGVLGKC